MKKKENACLFVFLVFSVWNKSHSATCDGFWKVFKASSDSWQLKRFHPFGIKSGRKVTKHEVFFILHHPVFKSLHRVHRYKTSRALSPFPGCVSLPSPPDEWTSPLTAPGFYRQTAAFASNLCREQLSQWRGSPLAVTRKGLTNQRYVRPRGGGV